MVTSMRAKTVTLTLNLSEAVTVAGGTPTLTLNDGGTATYTGGSGSNALTFSYTVGRRTRTPSTLAVTSVNLNGATVKRRVPAMPPISRASGDSTQTGILQIDTISADGVIGRGVWQRDRRRAAMVTSMLAKTVTLDAST